MRVKLNAKNINNYISFILLASISVIFVAMGSSAKQGALNGLALAQNTIIPSLLPLLIIFLTIMKSGANNVITKLFGRLTVALFNLPANTASAIIFGLVGGYPTGALITQELLNNDDIDVRQARRLLRFNFCGGCGFIITAVGTITLGSLKAGVLLFTANAVSAVILGFILSFSESRIKYEPFSFCEEMGFGNALSSATSSSVSSVLNITAYIVVFSALNCTSSISSRLMPLIEITNGVCCESFDLPTLAAYLAFGGICIHFQLIPIIASAKMKFIDFFSFRVLSALISYAVLKLLLLIFPMEQMVFSNGSERLVNFFSVNVTLSVLMVIGCFVLILDVSSHKNKLA